MAPEQIRGETVDGRTDLFALGATLLEVSTGKRIFAGENYSECVQKVIAFKTEQLDQFSEQLPVNFLMFLKRLMEPVPDERFRSAKEALEALHERIEERGTVQVKKSFSSIRLAFGISAAAILLSILVYSVAGRRSSDTSSLAIGEQKHTSETRTTQDSIGQPMQDRARQSDLAEEHRAPLRKETPRHDPELGKSGIVFDSGDVRFTSNPWAKVYVDGRFVGETPISQSMHLSKGKHVVTFSNPSFDPIVKTIEVRGENEGHISADFLENAGYLQCAVEPWAEVYIDEQYKDTTPLNKPIVCSAGKHTVRFHNNAFRDVIQEVSIKARDTLMITSSLPTLR
jgi:serine/threonine protein kinase